MSERQWNDRDVYDTTERHPKRKRRNGMKYGKLMDGVICLLTAWYMVQAVYTYGWIAVPIVIGVGIGIMILAAVVIGALSGTFHGIRGAAKYRAEQVGKHPEPFDMRVIPCAVEDLHQGDFIVKWRQVVSHLEDNHEIVYVTCTDEEPNTATACLDRGTILTVVRVA